jgi:3-dehydroquinate synthase
MPALEVRTSQSVYPNIVERGITQRVRDFVPRSTSKVFVVTTEDVWSLHGRAMNADFGRELNVLFFPGGEVNKRLDMLESLAEQMSEKGADRQSLVIGFGGGIVTDVSGFLAAVFMRGIPILQVPTTLLAQVDAAIGGKTGVNLTTGKNLVGSFHQPIAVLIDPEVLSTLPDREYRAGLYEVIKCGVIRDPELFDLFGERTEEILSLTPNEVDEIVARAVQVKVDVVSADEKESDLRRILNFGHTIGHALEAATGYLRFLHGEAIGWGMVVATCLSRLLGLIDRADARRISETVGKLGPLPPAHDLNIDELIALTGRDKKTLQGKVHWVLPTRIGQVEIVSGIDHSVLREAIVSTLK